MKTSKLQKFAWVFFTLVLATTTLLAQGYRNGNRVYNSQNGTCLEQISGLTEKQKTEIQALEKQHQKEMAELRDNRRSFVDATKKYEVRSEMLKKVEEHQKSVRNLLTADQQEEYNNLHAQRNNFLGNRGRNQGQQFAGNNRRVCRNGNGYRQGSRGNNGRNGKGCRGNRGRNGQYRNGNGYGNNSSSS